MSRAQLLRSFLRAGLLAAALVLVASCIPETQVGDPTGGGPEADRPSRVYHVQIGTVESKTTADQRVARALSWFESTPDDTLPDVLAFRSKLSVNVRWKPPFYRVRVGPFRSRADADAVLQACREVFPDAFIAPERVRS